MLSHLALEHIGPATKMELSPGSRLNLLTGDNGLGKSFLLDVIWWSLTDTWPKDINPELAGGYKAVPINGQAGKSKITFQHSRATQPTVSNYDRSKAAWSRSRGKPPKSGLVFYFFADGSVAIYDPIINTKTENPSAFVFSQADVWKNRSNDAVMQGLIIDWGIWQKSADEADKQSFDLFCQVLKQLSGDVSEVLEPGSLATINVMDAYKMPTIRTATGQEVPIIYASSAVKKMLSIAYVLTWGWQKHKSGAEIYGGEVKDDLVILIDELEAHLHPKWQRRILGALLTIKDLLDKPSNQSVKKPKGLQLFACTHSPLVMASAETYFDPTTDAWFDIDLEDNHVELVKRDFQILGTAEAWLKSLAFDLAITGSIEAEELIGRFDALGGDFEDLSKEDALVLDQELREHLPLINIRFVRWNKFLLSKGWIKL